VSVLTAKPVACFDVDGVLVDSEEAKIGAWLRAVTGICRPPPGLAAELDQYNRAHRGIPRADKFRHVIASLTTVGYPLPAGALEALLATYATLLEPLLATAPAAPGAAEFLLRWPGPVAVATSAPLAEATGHLTRLGFRPMTSVSAYPTSKTDALRQLARQSDGAAVFFGDAPSDQAAARAACIPFVGIGANIPAPGTAMLDHAQTLSGLLSREKQIADAVLKSAVSPKPADSD
jgi:beta-phosphoglucomutase-like phosphatase (HAD superfamily)